MNARRVHAVLAAAVHNPLLISQWRAAPRDLSRLGVEPELLDLEALWRFSGLTVKVRHNGVRQDLPATFRLLSAAELEIALFADYAAAQRALGREFAPTTFARTDGLVQFILGWVDRKNVVHALLADIVRHEHTILRLPAPTSESSTTDDASVTELGTVPIVRGTLGLHEMSCNPLKLAAELRRPRPSLKTTPKPSYFGYWRRDVSAAITMIELDALGFVLLSMVDGHRSVAVLSDALVGRRRPRRAFLRALERLQREGILIGRAAASA